MMILLFLLYNIISFLYVKFCYYKIISLFTTLYFVFIIFLLSTLVYLKIIYLYLLLFIYCMHFFLNFLPPFFVSLVTNCIANCSRHVLSWQHHLRYHICIILKEWSSITRRLWWFQLQYLGHPETRQNWSVLHLLYSLHYLYKVFISELWYY